jgi:hypothetical protein
LLLLFPAIGMPITMHPFFARMARSYRELRETADVALGCGSA